jgi:ABC-type sugar transport system permease subunit/ABC-type glycerol-3-phosphate transport system substrate-binding protein
MSCRSIDLRIVGLLWLLLAVGFFQPGSLCAQDREIHLATVNANYAKALNTIARRYEAIHPGVTVRVSIVTNEYSAWLRTQFAGGERIAPDIYNGNYTAEYIGLGRWVPLNDHLESINPYTGQPWIDGLNRALVERFHHGGEAFYIPLDFIDVAFVYNKEIFRQLDLAPPDTWEEMIELLEVIKQRGHEVKLPGRPRQRIIPMSMAGNAKAFWEGAVGWFVRILGDAYYRAEVELIRARPGDWNYIEERDAHFNDDFGNPYNDVYTTINNERLLMAIRDGVLRGDSPESRAIYQRILDLTPYWPPGFQGMDFGSAEALFMRQRAAISFTTSHFVTHSDRLMRQMDPEDRFEWGAFPPPRISKDPLCEGLTLRGIGNAGANYVVTKKSDPEHVARVIDFMMFLTTPESGTTLFEETIADDQYIVGPIQIQGVRLPQELAEKYAAFEGRGFEKLNLRGSVVEYEWTKLTQDLLAGSRDLDSYLKEFHEIELLRVEREVRRFNLDMDPGTRDVPPDLAELMRRSWNPFRSGLLVTGALFVGWLGLSIVGSIRAPSSQRHHAFLAILFLAPTILLLSSFVVWPAVSGVARAFTDWEDGRLGTFTGTANAWRLVSDSFIWRGLINMVLLTGANVFKATVIPFLVAAMLCSLPWPRLAYGLRTVFLLPMVTPTITAILIWAFIYDPNMGLLNDTLDLLGIEGHSWLGERNLALPSVIAVGFPWVSGLSLLLYMAGMMNIDRSLQEAASLDCRGLLSRLWHIDLPLVTPQTRIIVILTLIGSLQDFQGILLLTGGGPGLETSVPALQMYERAFKYGEFGYASMIGFMLFLLILGTTLAARGLSREEAS